jgi:hypothetical protein
MAKTNLMGLPPLPPRLDELVQVLMSHDRYVFPAIDGDGTMMALAKALALKYDRDITVITHRNLANSLKRDIAYFDLDVAKRVEFVTPDLIRMRGDKMRDPDLVVVAWVHPRAGSQTALAFQRFIARADTVWIRSNI